MDKIREAFESKLAKGKLSEQSKIEMMKANRKSSFRFVPAVTALVAVLSLFLAWSIWQTDSLKQGELVSTEPTNVKDLEQSILTYTNELLTADANEEFYSNIGEGYPLRLALEKNSGLFYGDIDLSGKEKMLISEFLHYLQEAHMLQLVIDVQPVESMEELLLKAPVFVEDWGNMLQSYKSISDEQKNPKIVKLGLVDRGVILLAMCVSIFVIIRLWRNDYRIPPIVWSIILVLWISSLFIRPAYIAFDETSMVKIIEEQLLDANIRLDGEPTVDVLAGNSANRYILLSYADGLEVVGTFQLEDGFFYYQNMSWGGSRTFSERGQFQETHIMTFIAPKSFKESHVQLNMDGDAIELEVPKGQANVFMLRGNNME